MLLVRLQSTCYLYDYKVVILVLIRTSTVYSELSIINLLLNCRPYVLNSKCAMTSCGLCAWDFIPAFLFVIGLVPTHPPVCCVLGLILHSQGSQSMHLDHQLSRSTVHWALLPCPLYTFLVWLKSILAASLYLTACMGQDTFRMVKDEHFVGVS